MERPNLAWAEEPTPSDIRRCRKEWVASSPWGDIGSGAPSVGLACMGGYNRIYIFLGENSRPLFLRDAMRRRFRIVAGLAGGLALDLVVDRCGVRAFNHYGNHRRGFPQRRVLDGLPSGANQ